MKQIIYLNIFFAFICLWSSTSYSQEKVMKLEYTYYDRETEFVVKVKGTPEDLENAIYAGSYLGEFKKTVVKVSDLADVKIKKRLKEMDKIDNGLKKLKLPQVKVKKTNLISNKPSLEEKIQSAPGLPNQANDPFLKLKKTVHNTNSLFNKGKFAEAYKKLRQHSVVMAKLRKLSIYTKNQAEAIRLYDEIIQIYFDDGLLKLPKNNSTKVVFFNTPAIRLEGATIRQLANFCMLYRTCRDEPYLGWLILLDQYKPKLALKIYSLFYKTIVLNDKGAEARVKSSLKKIVKKLDITKNFRRLCKSDKTACSEAYKQASLTLAKKTKVLWPDYSFDLHELY